MGRNLSSLNLPALGNKLPLLACFCGLTKIGRRQGLTLRLEFRDPLPWSPGLLYKLCTDPASPEAFPWEEGSLSKSQHIKAIRI